MQSSSSAVTEQENDVPVPVPVPQVESPRPGTTDSTISCVSDTSLSPESIESELSGVTDLQLLEESNVK